MEILKTIHLKKTYGKGDTQVAALKDINLTVEKGEFVAIIGTSGSGKSTLLHMMGGLDVPTKGSVIVDQKNLEEFGDNELTIFRRRKVGFIFQQFNLIPMLTVWENIILPLKFDTKAVDLEYLNDIVTTLGLSEKKNSYPGELSGGQQQRVAIARAMASKPSIILADEPTGNLDSKTSQDVLGILKIANESYQQTIVMITHNEEIAQMADRVIRIEDGQIVYE